MTQRSQRTPLTWIVSVCRLTLSILRARDELAAERAQALTPPELELLVRLGETRRAREPDEVRELLHERAGRHESRSVRVNELGSRSKAKRGPAVLRVDAAVRRAPGLEPLGHRRQELRYRRGCLERRRLIGHANLESAEARVRAHVP